MARDFYAVEIGDVPQWCLELPTLLTGGALVDPWMFVDGKPVTDPGPLKTVPFHVDVKRTFSVANAGRTPIANEQAASVFRELAPDDVQLFPIEISDTPERYYVVNATRRFKCIDEANCREVQIYPLDGAIPERAGEYRSIIGLRIDTSKIEDARVFRPMGWESTLIVSEEVKQGIERVGNTGVFFNRVTGPQSTP
ncbi:imm11 family protein [Corallococcus interemptor]|uniref:imm11 family protein n=1 Tax=Corallococcus interemptor TaxID=2316720 RepID=UPI003D01D590